MSSITFEKRYFLFDFARGRSLHKEETKDLLCVLQRAGYNGICLHLEGFFETDAYPGKIRDGYLKKQEAQWFLNESKKRNMTVIPVINLVGHAEAFVYYQERFADMKRDREHHQFNLYDSRLMAVAYNIIDEVIHIFHPEYLHIGGDETALNAEEKKLYTEFLSKLCAYVTAKGVKPCIWGDMLFEHQELAEDFTKDVTVFDWWYMAHRPESLAFFKEKGFREIFACPCDQGWDGFIGVQRRSPWQHAMPKDTREVKADEVEAFLSDAAELGIKNGLFTNWENTNAHNLWSQMSSIVRGGLYMNATQLSEENIEAALFGRQTVYTKASFILQNMQRKLYDAVLLNEPEEILKCRISDAVFEKNKFISLFYISEKIIKDIELAFENGLESTKSYLDGWTPVSNTEKRCRSSLMATMYYAKALYLIIKLGSYGYANYHRAAVCQFENKELCIRLLQNTDSLVCELADALQKFYDAQKAALADSGQTAADVLKLLTVYNAIHRISEELNKIISLMINQDAYDVPVLPSFEKLLKENINL